MDFIAESTIRLNWVICSAMARRLGRVALRGGPSGWRSSSMAGAADAKGSRRGPAATKIRAFGDQRARISEIAVYSL